MRYLLNIWCCVVEGIRVGRSTSRQNTSGGGPVHTCVPIHAHPHISPKQSQLHNKLPVYIIHLIVIYVVVNIFSMKNYRFLRKFRVGMNRYTGELQIVRKQW